MPDAIISAEITAKIDGLRDGFKQAERETERFKGKMESTLSDVDKAYIKNARSAQQNSNIVTSTTKTTATSIVSLGKAFVEGGVSSSEYSGHLQNLSDVLKDVRITTSGGASGIKSLASSLSGVNGLSIAISVASAAIFYYIQYQQKASKATEDAKKSADAYIQTLNQVDQANLKGAQSAQSELVTLKLLYDQTQNVALSQEQRIKASDELQSKYPKYFKSYTDEAILAGQAAGKYNELTGAILASGRARAAVDLIAKNQSRKLEDEQKIIDLQKEQVKIEKDLNEARALGQIGKDKLVDEGLSAGTIDNSAEILRLEKARTENKTLQRNLATDINLIDTKNLQLVKSVNKEIEKGADLNGGVGKETKTPKVPKEKAEKNFRDAAFQLRAITDVSGRAIISLDSFQDQYNKTADQLGTKPLIPVGAINSQVQALTSDIDILQAAIEDLAYNTIDMSLMGIGSAIGEAMANGTNAFEAGGKALLGSFGGFITEYGKLLIKYGSAAVLKGKLDLAALVPGAGIPAGIAAIAAGVALVAAGAAIGSFAGGKSNSNESGATNRRRIPGFARGIEPGIFGGGIALVGEEGPELVNLPTGAGVVNNRDLTSAISGRQDINITGRLGISMRQLILEIDRERALQGRTG